MSSFTSPLRLEFDWHGNPDKPFVLLEAFTYRVGEERENKHITVPVGFRTDFASIPRAFKSLFSPTGCYGKAAITHDYLYEDGWVSQLLIDDITGDTFELMYRPTRKEADGIFKEAMEVLGVGWWTRHAVYIAVRIGGRGSFTKETD